MSTLERNVKVTTRLNKNNDEIIRNCAYLEWHVKFDKCKTCMKDVDLLTQETAWFITIWNETNTNEVFLLCRNIFLNTVSFYRVRRFFSWQYIVAKIILLSYPLCIKFAGIWFITSFCLPSYLRVLYIVFYSYTCMEMFRFDWIFTYSPKQHICSFQQYIDRL